MWKLVSMRLDESMSACEQLIAPIDILSQIMEANVDFDVKLRAIFLSMFVFPLVITLASSCLIFLLPQC
jgi:hypothetical protein